MSIELKDLDGKVGLHVVCDLCLKHVEAANANLLFEQHPDCNAFLSFVACKGKCTAVADSKRKWQWIPMDAAIVYLIRNSKLDVEAAGRTADALSSVG
jgi:hypothetical protein